MTAAENDSALTNLALQYAENIEPQVKNNVKQIQGSLGGKGCSIGGR